MKGDIHVYDECAGKLYLNDGREIRVNPKLFSSVEQALKVLKIWARSRKVIGAADEIAAFVV
ncbi:MAG: hypothetical protein SWN10_20165 [Pseudomonadota bacterium]|nr:hypothetical protein [Pseudomonadota bacterium]